MEISKLRILWSLVTGGWAKVAKYILEVVNKWLATIEPGKMSKAAEVVNSIAQALSILSSTFMPKKYAPAVSMTLEALRTLAVSLSDGKVTQEELDANIDAIQACIEVWSKVS